MLWYLPGVVVSGLLQSVENDMNVTDRLRHSANAGLVNLLRLQRLIVIGSGCRLGPNPCRVVYFSVIYYC